MKSWEPKPKTLRLTHPLCARWAAGDTVRAGSALPSIIASVPPRAHSGFDEGVL